MKKTRADYDTKKLQEIVGRRDGWHCHYCGCELVGSKTYEYLDMAGMVIEGITITFEYLVDHHYTTWEKIEIYQRGVKPATIDHIVPISRGGDPKDPNNVVLSCRNCNSRKRTNRYEDFTNTLFGGKGMRKGWANKG